MPPRPRPPREVPTGTLPVAPRQPLREAALSAAAHLLVLLRVIGVVSKEDLPKEERPKDQPPPVPPPQQVVLPPYVPPKPQPQQQQAPPQPPKVLLPSTPQAQSQTPAPPASSQPKEDRPNAPPDEQKKDGVREPEPDAKQSPKAADRSADQPTTPAPAKTPTPPIAKSSENAQEEEARRLFGTKRRADATDDPITIRPFAMGPDGKPVKCEPLPKFERDSLGRAPMGVAVGRILRDDGRPLGGALLQMIGTQFVAFTDDNGEYRFTYDMSLIEGCRTQYVRVSAKGYESRLLVLIIGEKVRSDDVELRRNSRLPFNLRPGG